MAHLSQGRAARAPYLALITLLAWGTLPACAASDRQDADGLAAATESPGVGELVDLAERAREAGDLDGAIDAYRAALDRTPWNARLEQRLSAAYAERAASRRDAQGVFGLKSAEADLREARRLSPDDAIVRRNLAVVLVDRAVRTADPEEARELREEAHALDPEIARVGADRRADLERRLDLAYELLARGQIDAGIERLEALHAEHPDHEATTRMLAQALARKAELRAGRGRHAEAGPLLDRAVALYARLAGGSPPQWTPDLRDEVERAHRNRIVTWLNASRPDEARRALEEAERAGLRFPALAPALRRDPSP